MAAPLETEFHAGRGELRIPPITSRFKAYEGIDVIRFFRRFWEINGHPEASDRDHSPYEIEKVVPAEDGKPLLYLRSELKHTPAASQEDDRAYSRRISDGRHVSATVAVEKHKILTPPNTCAGWIPLVDVTYGLDVSSGSGLPDVRQPSITVGGEGISNRSFDVDLQNPQNPYSLEVRNGLRKIALILS